jgi:esterase/lipase superfamily enzyme
MIKISFLIIVIVTCCSACSTYKPFTSPLMNTPSIYFATGIDPHDEGNPIPEDSSIEILYATDRAPTTEGEGKKQKFYLNERGQVLRLGKASVSFTKEGTSWADIRKYSFLEEHLNNFPLQVENVHETGLLNLEIPKVMEEYDEETAKASTREFTQVLNEMLGKKTKKDIFIFVHGYKVEFENPIIVASELWHYLGNNGIMLAYAWPSTPDTLAYFGDLETAAISSQNFRYLLQYLASDTDVERIHIIGYSAGTRVVAGATRDLALIHSKEDPEDVRRQLKIENVILIASDMDRNVLRGYFRDGITNVTRYFTLYGSTKDKALGISHFVFGRRKAGDFNFDDALSKKSANSIIENPNLSIIDVTGAANFQAANGHRYFRESPWVSSDIFINLLTDIQPGERGLIREEGDPAWIFPEDYVERLKELAETRLK